MGLAVKRRRDGEVIVRWTATGRARGVDEFRRIAGHRDMPKLERTLTRSRNR